VEHPNQADTGAQAYWQNCQPCHGDQAQGLTDDWRQQYPPEDEYCWERGCHGNQPYENGFILPTVVPALAGEGSLGKFTTANDLFAYARARMPYQAPGSLSDETYWAITAHLLRLHGLPDAALPVDSAEKARAVLVAAAEAGAQATPAPGPTPTGVTILVPAVGNDQPAGNASAGEERGRQGPSQLLLVAALAAAGAVLGAVRWVAKRKSDNERGG
jgi:cytochrome c